MRRSHQAGAFLVLACAGALSVYGLGQHEADALRGTQRDASLTIWHSQIAGCKRGNHFREGVNSTRSALQFVLLSQADESSSKLRARYMRLAESIRPEPLVDCASAYPKPLK